jgi:hypothetical protein
MKRRGAVLILAGAVLCAAAPLKKPERGRLIAHFEMTNRWLADEVNGLSAAQLNYKPNDDAWSVLHVVEHLMTAEAQYWDWVQESLKQPATGFTAQAKDEAVLWYGIDRTQRSKTAEARAAKGELKDVKAGLDTVLKRRAAMLEFVRITEEDLRGRQFKGGQMDLYQWIMMISTHGQRHILQIREVKAHPGFPSTRR